MNEMVRDRYGNIIGYMRGDRVYDSRNNLLGWVEDNLTKDALGNVVALTRAPGILLSGSNNV